MLVQLLFDEVEKLKTTLRITPKAKLRQVAEDGILDLMLLGYIYGYKDVNESMGKDSPMNESELNKTLNRKIDGKTYKDRINEYASTGDVESLERVAETEIHRAYSDGSYNTAVFYGATSKTWQTLKDDKVRDTHWFLDGVTVGMDEDFYTYNGNHAKYPSAFGVAEEDINCRCFLIYR